MNINDVVTDVQQVVMLMPGDKVASSIVYGANDEAVGYQIVRVTPDGSVQRLSDGRWLIICMTYEQAFAKFMDVSTTVPDNELRYRTACAQAARMASELTEQPYTRRYWQFVAEGYEAGLDAPTQAASERVANMGLAAYR